MLGVARNILANFAAVSAYWKGKGNAHPPQTPRCTVDGVEAPYVQNPDVSCGVFEWIPLVWQMALFWDFSVELQ